MSRRRVLLVLARGLAGLTAGALGPRLVRAGDPAQRVARLGFVSPTSPSIEPYQGAFWQRMRELGWIEGQNLIVERRWAQGRADRLPALMAEVIDRNIDVLVTYSTPGGVAAKNATSTIPIVDATMGDPIEVGLAASLSHPGSNLTGMSMGWTEDLAGKWLELLQEMVPRLSTIAVMANPDHLMMRDQAKRIEAIAPARGLKIRIIQVRGSDSLDQAFAKARKAAQALLVLADTNLIAQRPRVVKLAAMHRLPAMHTQRDFVDAGGLMAYCPDYIVMFRRTADYVDKILKGTKPADLPIEQPTKFELVVNLKTAKALGITIPESILLRADEVIR